MQLKRKAKLPTMIANIEPFSACLIKSVCKIFDVKVTKTHCCSLAKNDLYPYKQSFSGERPLLFYKSITKHICIYFRWTKSRPGWWKFPVEMDCLETENILKQQTYILIICYRSLQKQDQLFGIF